MSEKKHMLIIYLILIIFILFLVFYNFNYKILKNGNNKLINKKNINEYLFNISSYKAKIEVTVYNNKIINKYLFEQIYSKDKSIQKIIEPKELSEIQIIRENNNVEIINNKLDLSTKYLNYDFVNDNYISLEGFINDFINVNNKTCIEENDNQKIYEVNISNFNKYIKYKKLYINKKKNVPDKLEIMDVNRNILFYIEYKEIEIQ